MVVDLRSNQMPNLHEWSRIEIGHVEEGGNYFITLSVGRQEVGREAFELGRDFTDVTIYSGTLLPSLIRRLVVLDKQ